MLSHDIGFVYRQTDGRTDGHGETSIPPYNFVAGGIKIEKIQERALKFIYNENHSTYAELLAKSKLPSLKIRRIRTIAIETFKIINKETPQYLHDLVTLKNNKYNFRYSNTAHIPTVKTTRYVIDIMLQKIGMSRQTTIGKKHFPINLRV